MPDFGGAVDRSFELQSLICSWLRFLVDQLAGLEKRQCTGVDVLRLFFCSEQDELCLDATHLVVDVDDGLAKVAPKVLVYL